MIVHPLDGLLAFMGALGFLGALVATPICAAFEWSSNDLEKRYNPQHKSHYPVTFIALCITAALLLLTLILGFVNMALPAIHVQ